MMKIIEKSRIGVKPSAFAVLRNGRCRYSHNSAEFFSKTIDVSQKIWKNLGFLGILS